MSVRTSTLLPAILFQEMQNAESMDASLERWAGSWVVFVLIFSSVKLQAEEGTLTFHGGRLLTEKMTVFAFLGQ